MARKVVVAMSGGVDSSVAAGLLVEAGYDVVGLTMRLYTEPDETAPESKRTCCGVEAIDDARGSARALGIPYYVLNFEREFGTHVVDYFVDSYARGETPNPCLACNRSLKFDALLTRALAMGADAVATGHYARIEGGASGYRLRRAIDPSKDQSYVLYTLGQAELARVLMPVGGFTKDEIRAHARRLGLPVADKAESQDICFIPDRNYRRFVEGQGLAARPGELVLADGRVVGRHDGVHGFTVGQRRGIGIASPLPLYVRSIDAESARVTVAQADDLGANAADLRSVSFVAGAAPARFETRVQLRYRAPLVPVTVVQGAGGAARLEFGEERPVVTPGQAAVFYDGDVVLGGGVIERAHFAG